MAGSLWNVAVITVHSKDARLIFSPPCIMYVHAQKAFNSMCPSAPSSISVPPSRNHSLHHCSYHIRLQVVLQMCCAVTLKLRIFQPLHNPYLLKTDRGAKTNLHVSLLVIVVALQPTTGPLNRFA